jgi:hypothetical protein
MNLRIALALVILTAIPAFGQSQPWKKQIAVDANLSIPGGDVGEGLGTGYGGTATFYYQLLTRNTFLSASVGWNTFDYDAFSGMHLTVIPLLVGMRYNFAITGFQPYIGLEFGMYLSSASSNDNTVTLAESETDAGIQPKIGFRLPISPGLDFDASLKWHNIFADDASFSILAPGIGIAYTID